MLSQMEQVEVSPVSGADHFFSGEAERLQQVIIATIGKLLS